MQTTDQPLSGKVAIVTGAGRGIGKAIARAYAKAGAAVCCAARTEADLHETVQAIVAAGGQGLAVPTDVTQLAAVHKMVQVTVETFGGLDILVINAGVQGERRPVEDSHPEAWRTTLEINLLGAYYCAQAAIAALKQRGAGKIITVGSGIGHRGVVGRNEMDPPLCGSTAMSHNEFTIREPLEPQEASPMKQEMYVLGIDIAKRVFHAVGMDDRGNVVYRKRLSRHDLMPCIMLSAPFFLGL